MGAKRKRHLVKSHMALNPPKKEKAPTPPKKTKRKPSRAPIVRFLEDN